MVPNLDIGLEIVENIVVDDDDDLGGDEYCCCWLIVTIEGVVSDLREVNSVRHIGINIINDEKLRTEAVPLEMNNPWPMVWWV